MEVLTRLLAEHGVILLFGVGFLEFIGAPIAGIPMLIVAGGLAAMGGASMPLIVLAAALGGLLADLVWYATARVQGHRLVSVVCGLTSNPNACVLGVEHRVSSLGAPFLAVAKFVPGAGNLAAAASGLVPVSPAAFLLMDALGVTVWATVYTSLGWLFSQQVELVIQWASQLGTWLAVAAALGLIVAIILRTRSVRRHRKLHGPDWRDDGDAGRPAPSDYGAVASLDSP